VTPGICVITGGGSDPGSGVQRDPRIGSEVTPERNSCDASPARRITVALVRPQSLQIASSEAQRVAAQECRDDVRRLRF